MSQRRLDFRFNFPSGEVAHHRLSVACRRISIGVCQSRSAQSHREAAHPRPDSPEV